MAVLVVAIAARRNLFSVVMFTSIYSFLMATVLVALHAVDVAMTEASVGAKRRYALDETSPRRLANFRSA